MKKELDYIRNKYKKQNKRYITKYGIELREETLLDSKLEDVLNIELYCGYNQSLRDEYGSAVKIMNHIEMNVGLDRFKMILDYANTKNISGEEFIEFMNNNDKVIPEIVNENKDDDKKLTIDYFYLVCTIINIVTTFAWMHNLFTLIYPLYVTIPVLLICLIVLFSCGYRTFKYEKI